MEFFFENLRELLGIFPYSFLLPMLGSIIGGEGIIILLSTLAAAGVLPFWLVVTGSYTGTLIADSFWFFFGGHFFNWLNQKESVAKKLKSVSRFTDEVMNKQYFRTLIVTKFLYGARILTISYFSHKGLSFKRFTVYNIVATGFLTLIVCSVGWWIGQGLVKDDTLENLRLAVLVIVVTIIVFHFLRIEVYKKIFNKSK